MRILGHLVHAAQPRAGQRPPDRVPSLHVFKNAEQDRAAEDRDADDDVELEVRIRQERLGRRRVDGLPHGSAHLLLGGVPVGADEAASSSPRCDSVRSAPETTAALLVWLCATFFRIGFGFGVYTAPPA